MHTEQSTRMPCRLKCTPDQPLRSRVRRMRSKPQGSLTYPLGSPVAISRHEFQSVVPSLLAPGLVDIDQFYTWPNENRWATDQCIDELRTPIGEKSTRCLLEPILRPRCCHIIDDQSRAARPSLANPSKCRLFFDLRNIFAGIDQSFPPCHHLAKPSDHRCTCRHRLVVTGLHGKQRGFDIAELQMAMGIDQSWQDHTIFEPDPGPGSVADG